MDKFSDNNFQVINMNYKLKKIKKNKKNKNNYKNIETFETLDNTNNKDKDNNVEPFVSETPIIEGFPDSYYDGIDNINEKRKKGAANLSLVDFIERIYQYLIRINQVIAEKVAITLSNKKILSINKKTKTDNIYHIRQYIVWTESILAAAYITYNMYFIMYYKDVEEIKLLEITLERFNKEAEKYPILYLFLYVFEYSISVLETFNNLITVNIPYYTKTVLSTTLIFTLIFINLIFFIKYSAVFFKNFLIDTLNFKFSWFSLLIYFYVFGLWLVSLLKAGIEKALTIKVDASKFSIFLDVGLFLFNRLLKLILGMMFGVPAILFFIICFILIYTFVAIFFYMGFDMDIFKRIDEYVKVTKNLSADSVCDNPSFLYSFLKFFGYDYIMQFVEIIYNKLFIFTFILLYIVCSIRYSELISPNAGNLKNSLIFINIMIIIILLSIVAKEYVKKFVND
jgi:hypothetical protein